VAAPFGRDLRLVVHCRRRCVSSPSSSPF
jgi:hypothetical protein